MYSLAALAYRHHQVSSHRHSRYSGRRSHSMRFGETTVLQTSPNWTLTQYQQYAIDQSKDQTSFSIVSVGKDGSSIEVTPFNVKDDASKEYSRITESPGNVAYVAYFDKAQNANGPIDEGFFVAVSEVTDTVTTTTQAPSPSNAPTVPKIDTSLDSSLPPRHEIIMAPPPLPNPAPSSSGLGIAAVILGGLGGFLLLASKKAR